MQKIPVLDLGNVLVQVDFNPFLGWLAKTCGRSDPASVASLLSSSLFYDFEFGQIGRAEFARRLSRLYGTQIPVSELEEQFCSIFPGIVEGMDSALEELAAAGPVYCLTNTNEIHLEYIRKHFPAVSRFARIFASFEMNRRKPYPGIYVDLARELDLPTESFVFFDDVRANVEGALKAGMDAHLFQGVEGFRAVLKSF